MSAALPGDLFRAAAAAASASLWDFCFTLWLFV
jgi:hypothetical protein